VHGLPNGRHLDGRRRREGHVVIAEYGDVGRNAVSVPEEVVEHANFRRRRRSGKYRGADGPAGVDRIVAAHDERRQVVHLHGRDIGLTAALGESPTNGVSPRVSRAAPPPTTPAAAGR